jgi:hypothetical protein
MPELDPSQSKLLGALTITTIEHLGSDTGVIDADGELRKWRMARVGDDVALVDVPADDSGPRCINCYSVEVERFDVIDGRKFKIDPERLVYSLQWKHKGEPPDLDLALIQPGADHWVNNANLTPLGELRHRAPDAIDWAGVADVVPQLDAFEAAMDSTTVHRH